MFPGTDVPGHRCSWAGVWAVPCGSALAAIRRITLAGQPWAPFLSEACSWRDTSLLFSSQGMPCLGWHRVGEQRRGQEPLEGTVSPSNNAALTHIFFIPVEGTVSADDLCHTPVLSGM